MLYTRHEINDYLTCNQLGQWRREGKVQGLQLPYSTRRWIESAWPQYYVGARGTTADTKQMQMRERLGAVLKAFETLCELEGFNPDLDPEIDHYSVFLRERNLIAAVLHGLWEAQPVYNDGGLCDVSLWISHSWPGGDYKLNPSLFDSTQNKLYQIRVVSKWDRAAQDELLRDPSLCLDSLVIEERLGKGVDYLSVQPIVVGSRKEDHYDCGLLRYWQSRVHGAFSLNATDSYGKRLGKDWDKVVLTDLDAIIKWVASLTIENPQGNRESVVDGLFPMPVVVDKVFLDANMERAKYTAGELFKSNARNHRACEFPTSCPAKDLCWG